MSTRALPLFAVLLLGCAVGFSTARLWPTRAPAGDPVRPVPIAAADAKDRASALLALSDPVQRFAELTELISTAAPDARPAFAEAIAESALDGGAPEVVLLGLWSGRLDPEAALRWTRTEWRARFGSVIAAIFRGWAQHAPEQALVEALKTSFRGQRQLAVEAALAGWDESGRAGLLDAATPLILGADPWVGNVLARRRVGALGLEGAIRWLESIENGELRETLVGPIAEAGARNEEGGPAVARWAAPRITGVDHRTGLPLRIGTQWVRYDPDAAMTWLQSLPDGVDRDEGVAGAYGAWMARDGAAAFAWAEHIPIERWNEPAIAVYTRSIIVYGRALEALDKAARFSNPDLRDQTTIQIVLAWLSNDRASAVAWLEHAELSEGVRTRVREMVEVRREARDAAGGASQANEGAAAAAPPVPAR